jgi:DNA-binding MarR family transcriptional regulator
MVQTKRDQEELQELRQALRSVLRGLWRRRRGHLELLRGESRLTPRHIAVLAHIGTEGPRTVGDIARELGLSLPAASKLTRELEERTLVRRSEHIDDRRRTVVDLNALTSQRVQDWLQRRNRPLETTLDALSPAERRGFLKGLRVLADALRDEAASAGEEWGAHRHRHHRR